MDTSRYFTPERSAVKCPFHTLITQNEAVLGSAARLQLQESQSQAMACPTKFRRERENRQEPALQVLSGHEISCPEIAAGELTGG
ncbi:MAG: hypothetical protein AUK47_17445 [Deltaproteobacteria bacterium CG2_30_63_29]|nr:MAG: hypothetical protein AUK47_17445 [Deltaproteobacteria bacterium CG2_30_63_29]PIW01862.1 MAG: hypothetical protein COW42_03550 [Deltaproteobacteria bacterium CG17_big_fil_post_rev_8_21_14_2_50_63_7]PJB35510.1 MAG: hypothetical protein CO108_25495 [Deltaproteobacteria bacterium CG_4_9_14_3_um_filter_63_12]